MTEQLIKKREAVIFDIQHFSLNDGPGIRTTIFFKGCPLRCIWCHNPESYIQGKQLSYKSNLCTGCFECTLVCPSGALQKKKHNGRWVLAVDYDLCVKCGKCVDVCCYDALSIIGTTYTADEVLEQIKSDIPYYGISKDKTGKGGVTFTGGEPMMQLPFIEELIDKLDGVHICMETCGYAETKDFERIAEKVDLFLFDYKVTGSQKHKELCGADNKLILANLDTLYNLDASIILRLPLIPNINDTEEHFEDIYNLLKKYPKIIRAEIMAYNNFGYGKAEMLGIEDQLINKENADKAMKEKWLGKLKKLGVEVIIG